MGRTLPAPDSTAGRTVPPRFQDRPGGSALGRCQPRCRPDGLTRAPPPPTPFPIPSPASGAPGPRRRQPCLRRGRCSPRGRPGLPPQAPRPPSSQGSASGGAQDSESGRGGGSGRPSSQPGRRPRLREPERRERQGRGGRRRGGRRSSATPVTSGATRLPFSSFPPPSPVGEGKVAVAAPCPGRSECARAKMAYIQVGLRLGGKVRGAGGGCRAPSGRERAEGRAHGWAPTNLLREKGCPRARSLCSGTGATQDRGLGTPTPGDEGPLWTLPARPGLLGREWGWGGLFCPHPLPLHPTPGEGPRGGRPGTRQPPGSPAAVAVATALANWPAERA